MTGREPAALGNTMTFKHRLFRYILLLGACGWGISFLFTFTPWALSTQQLYCMGATEIPYQPLLDYWLKMASSTFGCIGIMYFLCFLNPPKYRQVISLLSLMSVFVGVTLLASALVNKLSPALHPTFIVDISFCLSVGLPSLYFNRTLAGQQRSSPDEHA